MSGGCLPNTVCFCAMILSVGCVRSNRRASAGSRFCFPPILPGLRARGGPAERGPGRDLGLHIPRQGAQEAGVAGHGGPARNCGEARLVLRDGAVPRGHYPGTAGFPFEHRSSSPLSLCLPWVRVSFMCAQTLGIRPGSQLRILDPVCLPPRPDLADAQLSERLALVTCTQTSVKYPSNLGPLPVPPDLPRSIVGEEGG